MTALAVPADTRLSLAAGEWASHLGVPGAVPLEVRTVAGRRLTGLTAPAGMVWVRGHLPECERSGCARSWCVRVAVRLDVLYDAVAGSTPRA
ncbi:hypothetical protein [Micromonospora carbonacea]|uniref:Uncharacterized protein n=1 Tax=Micromonospora carbonacea TaxID=47853 RepID=A0A1C4X0U4_9ACTN|nr:hypothetical protein [Micromonospora carbonacea]SCF02085.1 hypothetical protein GA0070563_104153 [Micromonospora carbonacea]